MSPPTPPITLENDVVGESGEAGVLMTFSIASESISGHFSSLECRIEVQP